MNDIVPSGNGPPDPVTALLMRAATDPSFDAGKFEVAVTFLRERETRAAHRAFNEAMSRAQAEMEAVPKDASNDYLRSRYATLPGMLGVIKPITSTHGLAFRFSTLPHTDPDWMTVTCILSLGDHVETTALSGPILSGEGTRGGRTQMNNLQAVGGTVTYLSRYLLGMVFSLIQHMPDIAADNDGNGGNRPPRDTPRQSTPPSHPPYDVPPQDAPRRPQEAATAGAATATGNRPIDDAAWLARLRTRLPLLPRVEDITALMAMREVKAWYDGTTQAVRDQINTLCNARLAELRPTPTAPDPTFLMPSPHTPLGGSPELRALLDTIASKTDFFDATTLAMNPEFSREIVKLPLAEQEIVDAALKAKIAALEANP